MVTQGVLDLQQEERERYRRINLTDNIPSSIVAALKPEIEALLSQQRNEIIQLMNKAVDGKSYTLLTEQFTSAIQKLDNDCKRRHRETEEKIESIQKTLNHVSKIVDEMDNRTRTIKNTAYDIHDDMDAFFRKASRQSMPEPLTPELIAAAVRAVILESKSDPPTLDQITNSVRGLLPQSTPHSPTLEQITTKVKDLLTRMKEEFCYALVAGQHGVYNNVDNTEYSITGIIDRLDNIRNTNGRTKSVSASGTPITPHENDAQVRRSAAVRHESAELGGFSPGPEFDDEEIQTSYERQYYHGDEEGFEESIKPRHNDDDDIDDEDDLYDATPRRGRSRERVAVPKSTVASPSHITREPNASSSEVMTAASTRSRRIRSLANAPVSGKKRSTTSSSGGPSKKVRMSRPRLESPDPASPWKHIDVGYQSDETIRKYIDRKLAECGLPKRIIKLIDDEDYSRNKPGQRKNVHTRTKDNRLDSIKDNKPVPTRCWLTMMEPKEGWEGPIPAPTPTSRCAMCEAKHAEGKDAECFYFVQKAKILVFRPGNVFHLLHEKGGGAGLDVFL